MIESSRQLRVSGMAESTRIIQHPVHRARRSRRGNGSISLHGTCSALALLALIGTVSAGEVPKERQRALVHLLRHDCGSCHGMTLRGGLGPPLTPAALDGKSQSALEATILNGRAGTPMPPWRNLLSDAEVRWLVEALKSGKVQ